MCSSSNDKRMIKRVQARISKIFTYSAFLCNFKVCHGGQGQIYFNCQSHNLYTFLNMAQYTIIKHYLPFSRPQTDLPSLTASSFECYPFPLLRFPEPTGLFLFKSFDAFRCTCTACTEMIFSSPIDKSDFICFVSGIYVVSLLCVLAPSLLFIAKARISSTLTPCSLPSMPAVSSFSTRRFFRRARLRLQRVLYQPTALHAHV